MQVIPDELRAAAKDWAKMARDERRQLVRRLRACGLSYGEIAAAVPVPKATLAGWCRGISLSADQSLAIQRRRWPRRGSPRDTQRKRRLEVEKIRADAREQGWSLMKEPFFVGGVALYWAEGSKSQRCLQMANSDAKLLGFFVEWVRRYEARDAEFVLALNLHADNDLRAAENFWTSHLPLAEPRFTKAFIKPDGTGHRKNHLAHGVCRVTMCRSTDAWYRCVAWIEQLAEAGSNAAVATLLGGR